MGLSDRGEETTSKDNEMSPTPNADPIPCLGFIAPDKYRNKGLSQTETKTEMIAQLPFWKDVEIL